MVVGQAFVAEAKPPPSHSVVAAGETLLLLLRQSCSRPGTSGDWQDRLLLQLLVAAADMGNSQHHSDKQSVEEEKALLAECQHLDEEADCSEVLSEAQLTVCLECWNWDRKKKVDRPVVVAVESSHIRFGDEYDCRPLLDSLMQGDSQVWMTVVVAAALEKGREECLVVYFQLGELSSLS